MKLISYAQNYEDVLLWRALRDVRKGRYIDIGAHDPVVDSVSLSFYEAGWRGVHVEPIPHYAARLREARPEEDVIEAAVDDRPGPIPFFELDGLSSGRPDVAEHHARAGHLAREILVPTVRLEHLLNRFEDEVHWLKIDVEGMEQQVLKSWGDCPKRPWILVVEATFPNSQEPTHHLWIDDVLSRGYSQAHFDGLSRYFVHQEHEKLAGRLTAPANVFDAFSITSTHFSAKPIREELEALSHRLGEQRRQAAEMNAVLGRTQHELDSALNEQDRAIERLMTAENEHRQALNAAIEHGRDSERRATEAEAVANATRVELARFEERSAQLQDKLDRASQVAESAEIQVARLGGELQRANEAAMAAGQRFAESLRESADLRSGLLRAQAERDDAYAATEQMRSDHERQVEDLQGTADRLRASVERASGLIRAVAAERSGRWHRIGAALGLTRGDLAWRTLASWPMQAADQPVRATAHWPTESESKTTMHNPASIGARNPYLRANSLEELISWDDVDFVRCAYVTILGRQPDPDGEVYYTDRIRRGRSKLEVLWQLRRSPEGPTHDPGIAGLDRALRRARGLGWPVRALRWVAGGTPPPSIPLAPAPEQAPANSHNANDAGASAQASAEELEALKVLMDGFAHALRGVANAQARHEEQINRLLSSAALPSRPVARRPSGSK